MDEGHGSPDGIFDAGDARGLHVGEPVVAAKEARVENGSCEFWREKKRRGWWSLLELEERKGRRECDGVKS